MTFFVFRQTRLPDGSLGETRIATGRRFDTNGETNDVRTDAAAWVADRPNPDAVFKIVEVPT
ncbi:MAG TPA: hypothetical protein VGQ44_17280 [Gemmatimonadaceae bacterium]|jgi:hypothetical protein|nr:hypothetical protein [Gemmatimonadaceae bacterium]